MSRPWRDPLAWALAALAALTLGMPALKPLFAAAFPALDRPLYEQDSFAALLGAMSRSVPRPAPWRPCWAWWAGCG